MKRKIIIYALTMILQQYHRLKEPAMVKDITKLPEYIKYCNTTFDLPYAHDIKYRLNIPDQRLLIKDFHPHWLYDKKYVKNREFNILDLVQNPRVIKRKNHPKEALRGTNTAKSQTN